jgi:hypothetical protein
MYLLYLDDAGSPANAAEDYFVLGGICVYEAQVDWFGRELDKLAAPYNATAPEDIKFHASTIFSTLEAPWRQLSIAEARGTLKSVLNVVSQSYDTTRLFACAIEKKSNQGRDIVETAFEDLCQRFDFFLSRRKAASSERLALNGAFCETLRTLHSLWTRGLPVLYRLRIMSRTLCSAVTIQAMRSTSISSPIASIRRTTSYTGWRTSTPDAKFAPVLLA